MFEIVRSPAKVCWHIMFNGSMIDTADTKRHAEHKLEGYEKAYRRLA